MRTWNMYGHQVKNGVWTAVGHKRFVELHYYGVPPVAVTVTEDPNGDYMGWIKFGSERPPEPVMIQHHRIFGVQFPYGYKAEVERGRGEAIPLSITIRDETGEA